MPPPMGGSPRSGLCLARRRGLHRRPGWPSSHAVTRLPSWLPCFVWGSCCSRAAAGRRAGARSPCASRSGVGALPLRCRSLRRRVWLLSWLLCARKALCRASSVGTSCWPPLVSKRLHDASSPRPADSLQPAGPPWGTCWVPCVGSRPQVQGGTCQTLHPWTDLSTGPVAR